MDETHEKMPRGRKQKVLWLEKKLGKSVHETVSALTDREFNVMFRIRYHVLKQHPDFDDVRRRIDEIEASVTAPPLICVRCEQEAEIIWSCGCNIAPLTSREEAPEEWDEIMRQKSSDHDGA